MKLFSIYKHLSKWKTIPSKAPMRESTKAYTAGLMDAEGCFSIYKATPKPGERTPYQPRIVMASVNLPIVKWLVETFGGFYTKHVPAKGRTWYQWNLNGRKAAPYFLSCVIPYLRIKTREAVVLKAFYDLGSVQNPEARKALMEQIRADKNRECLTTDTLDGHVDDKQIHAYLAGIIDGEGCISAVFTPTGKPMVRIVVANNFMPLIDLFIRMYGGWYHTAEAKGNTAESYTWQVTRNDLREKMLLQTLPYLRIKREQAKLALRYVRLPKETARAERTAICDVLRSLNSPKIQSDLTGDRECAPVEMLVAQTQMFTPTPSFPQIPIR